MNQPAGNVYRKLDKEFKEAIWGGNKLSEYFPQAPEKMSEVWLFANTPDFLSTASNTLLSDKICPDELKIVVKLINAEKQLSIQVHPVKNELIYVCEANEDACIYYGLKKDCSDEDIRQIKHGENILSLMNSIHVKAGDIYLIPHGTIHSYGAGIVAVELQNNSLETYRIYDFHRLENGKMRPVHIEKAVEVMSFKKFDILGQSYLSEDNLPSLSGIFAEKIQIITLTAESDMYRFTGDLKLIVCLDGSGYIDEVFVKTYDAFFVESFCGYFCLKSKDYIKLMVLFK